MHFMMKQSSLVPSSCASRYGITGWRLPLACKRLRRVNRTKWDTRLCLLALSYCILHMCKTSLHGRLLRLQRTQRALSSFSFMWHSKRRAHYLWSISTDRWNCKFSLQNITLPNISFIYYCTVVSHFEFYCLQVIILHPHLPLFKSLFRSL